MKIVVTGDSGYIGKYVKALLLQRGHEVIISLRDLSLQKHTSPVFIFDLSNPRLLVLPKSTDVVLHLATMANKSPTYDQTSEVKSSKNLIEAATCSKAKFIFLSSQTAHPEAATAYGRMKWEIEEIALLNDGYVVRAGQVYGGEPRGLFGVLQKIVKQSPIIPLFIPPLKIQPIHVEDLVEGIVNLVEKQGSQQRLYELAMSTPVSLTTFLKNISKYKLRALKIYLPVPVFFLKIINLLVKYLSIKPSIVTRISSLFNLNIMNTHSDLKNLNLVLRELKDGMHPSGSNQKRALLLEGRALILYVAKEVPSNFQIRQYVRAIGARSDGFAMKLPRLFIICPTFMSLISRSNIGDSSKWDEFLWRLDSATRFSEASAIGAKRFLLYRKKQNIILTMFKLLGSTTVLLLWLTLRLIFKPIIKYFLNR